MEKELIFQIKVGGNIEEDFKKLFSNPKSEECKHTLYLHNMKQLYSLLNDKGRTIVESHSKKEEIR